jgi:hypothetical protein
VCPHQTKSCSRDASGARWEVVLAACRPELARVELSTDRVHRRKSVRRQLPGEQSGCPLLKRVRTVPALGGPPNGIWELATMRAPLIPHRGRPPCLGSLSGHNRSDSRNADHDHAAVTSAAQDQAVGKDGPVLVAVRDCVRVKDFLLWRNPYGRRRPRWSKILHFQDTLSGTPLT